MSLRADVTTVKAVCSWVWPPSIRFPRRRLSAVVLVHLLLVSTLAAYFPFSKLMHMGGVFLSPTRNLANNNRSKRHVNPWNYPVKTHTYEEWEEEFHDKIKAAGLPLEAEACPEKLLQIEPSPPQGDWRDPEVEFRKGVFCYSALPKNLNYLGLPNPREWQPIDADWKLPPDWKQIILDGMKDRLNKYRSFRLFMDICVRCGACADKCHFYIGSGDPKNMPVLRAELIRSVYRRYFTLTGRIFGGAGGRARADRRRHQGVVLLLLPVHRMPPLLGLLPLRH